MFKHILIFISLFLICLCDYLPMEKKSKYGDDVCGYYDKNGDYLVKPCDSGKYCVNPSSQTTSTLSFCQDVPKIENGLSTINEDCSTEFDCEYNLECKGQKCTHVCTTANFYPYRAGSPGSGYSCNLKAAEGYCEYKEYTKDTLGNDVTNTYYGSPTNRLQICGVYTFNPKANNIYEQKDTKYAYIGSVDSGEYVSDETLCKSGFALYYYPNGYLEDPSTGNLNRMYKRCVTPTSIDKKDKLTKSCVIYYKEKDEDNQIKKYNVDQLQNYFGPSGTSSGTSSRFDSIENELCNYNDFTFKIKMEKFKEYNDKLTDEEREKCGDLRSGSKYRYICDNKDLIKSWYFYENPYQYIVYNDREKLLTVLNHFIQKEFPLYQFSKILNIQYLITLLFLLYF